YANPKTGEIATEFPDLPNGSTDAIAGICDKSGRIFGLMPHPEAYLSPFNYPHWITQKQNGSLPKEGLGLQIFRNAVEFAKANLI
ncbi:MAG: phosphoribosylformylglycinamidine synthase subunit PurQ, partial [Lentisphaeria bacterium]